MKKRQQRGLAPRQCQGWNQTFIPQRSNEHDHHDTVCKQKVALHGRGHTLETRAADLYAEITAFAQEAIREHFTLDGFYHATQSLTTPEGSHIEKVGSVLLVDSFVKHLFLERGFTDEEVTCPLLYIGLHWRTREGMDKSAHVNEPLEIRRTYVSLGKQGCTIIERENGSAWTRATLQEEDIRFLKRMHVASTLPLTIVELYRSYQTFQEAIQLVTGVYPLQEGIDWVTRDGRILFQGGLSHFIRVIKKVRAGQPLSSSSELQTSRILLEHLHGHFQVLFHIVTGDPLQLKQIEERSESFLREKREASNDATVTNVEESMASLLLLCCPSECVFT